MAHLSHHHRLLAELAHHLLVREEAWRHQLDGDLSPKRDVLREEHDGHAAASELSADLELADRRRPEPLDDALPPVEWREAGLGRRVGVGGGRGRDIGRCTRDECAAASAEAVARVDRAAALRTCGSGGCRPPGHRVVWLALGECGPATCCRSQGGASQRAAGGNRTFQRVRVG